MTAPTGTLYPGALDTTTNIGSSVSPGNVIASAYADTQSSAILALEGSLGPNPGGVDWKQHVRVGTTAALPANTYSGTPNFTLTATANGALSVDSKTVNANDRILVKNEATASHNGIYTVTQTGGVSTPYILTRTVDYNASSLITPASNVAVSEGSVNAGSLWTLATAAPITLDTTSLSYTAIVSGGTGAVYAIDTGTANAYAIAPSPAIAAYTAGQQFIFKAANANTGASTLNVNGLGTKSITKFGTTALATGDIIAGQTISVVYDGTQFQDLDPGLTPVSHGGTGLTGPLSVGDVLVATGSTTLTNVPVGANNQIIVADSTQTAGLRWTSGMFGIYGSALLPNAKYIQKQVLNAASGANDVSAPPSGKRWYILTAQVSNPTAGSITAYSTFKNGGTYYQMSNSSSVSAGNYGATLIPNAILESTDTLSFHSSAAGLSFYASILEFDTTADLKTVKALSLATGNNTLYTAPAGKTAFVFGSNFGFNITTPMVYWNFSGSSRTAYWNLVLSGGSVVAPGSTGTNALSASTTVATGADSTLSSTLTLNTGDFFNLHVDAGTATQYAWVTLIEWS